MNLLQIFLSETMPNIPQLQLKEFDPNQIVRMIANTILTLATIVGMIHGGWITVQGVTSKDPSDIRQGILAMVGAVVVGGLVMLILNLVIL